MEPQWLGGYPGMILWAVFCVIVFMTALALISLTKRISKLQAEVSSLTPKVAHLEARNGDFGRRIESHQRTLAMHGSNLGLHQQMFEDTEEWWARSRQIISASSNPEPEPERKSRGRKSGTKKLNGSANSVSLPGTYTG